ncbi:MAG: energy transducer TonB [Candidatus Sulfotelmatobacter sp.]
MTLVLVIASGAWTGLAAGPQEPANPPAVQGEASQQPELPRRVRVSQGVSQGLLVKRVQPKYPEKARRERIQGTVKLRAMISKEGDVVDLTLVSGDPLLAKAALKAVKQWKYRPYLLEGRPVVVDTEIAVNFSLSG